MSLLSAFGAAAPARLPKETGPKETGKEYDRPEREAVPMGLMAPLFLLVLALGLFLTGLLPYGFMAKAVSQFRQGGTPIEASWSALLAVLSFLVLLRWCVVQTLSFVSHWKLSRRQGGQLESGPQRGQPESGPQAGRPESWPLVSILVPAFQESDTIASALRSLIELDYPLYEIIVVDDGSPDDTYEKASAFIGDHGRCRMRLFRKPNGGKWSALNLAFGQASGELILCIDADSRLSRDALKRLVAHMDDPGVAGVSGQITVRNRRNILTRLQAYEYIVANGGLRSAQSLLGAVLVVPGPIGLYRRAALQGVSAATGGAATGGAATGGIDHPLRPGEVPGPFSHETFAEDFQLSLTILAAGGRIVYEPRALSYTKSPDLTHTLLNQRYRWFRGTMQVLRIYRQRLRHLPRSNRRRLNLLIAALYPLDLYVLPPVNFIVLSGLIISAASSQAHASLLLWVGAAWLLNLASGTRHILTQQDDLSLLFMVPLYELYHGLLLNSAWAIAMFDEVRQSKMDW